MTGSFRRRGALGAAALLLTVAVLWRIGRDVRREPASAHAPAVIDARDTPRTEDFLPVAPLDPSVAVVVLEDEGGAYLLPGTEDLEPRLHEPGGSARADIAILQELLELYRKADGSMPIAPMNSVVVTQLRGKNAKRVAVLSARNSHLSAEGELLDRWGSAYFFHPAASHLMEIRSAGPDRILWTKDDIHLPETLSPDALP